MLNSRPALTDAELPFSPRPRTGDTITVIAPRAVRRAELDRENDVALEEETLP